MDHEQFSMQRLRESARIQPVREGGGWKRRALFHFTIFGAALCISLLYLAMRPIMRLGGMVAYGGPYAIAHPAPDWVWVMPLAIITGMICFFLNLFSSSEEGVNLMPLAWPALFLSLGWNFLEFAFAPPGGGFAWGWLVCGVTFVIMGGLPLLLAFKPARDRMRLRLQNGQGLGPYAGQVLLVALGVAAGVAFFKYVAA